MELRVSSLTHNESAASQVERELREAIIRLELMPGVRLSEQEIANRYGVSRQPVREALIALARSGLVEVRPNRGTVVVPISVQQMLEARFVRESVETAVVRRACETFDPWIRQRIANNLEQQERAVETGDYNQFRELDGQFHIMIAQGAGCKLAWRAIADMKSLIDRTCNLTLAKAETRKPLLVQHRAIVAAIDDRDADRAESMMREHLGEILKDLPQVAEQHPEMFAE